MTIRIIVGIDGTGSGDRAINFAKTRAERMKDCELILVYVVEWSPYSFQTPEENAERHKRRQQEVSTAESRILDPAVNALKAEGLSVRGFVKHGDVADTLDRIAKAEKADQIVVARSSEAGVVSRIFGSSTANLVMNASVPVTVVN
jgi:nucleotide-binding universal stress UspA family protein